MCAVNIRVKHSCHDNKRRIKADQFQKEIILRKVQRDNIIPVTSASRTNFGFHNFFRTSHLRSEKFRKSQF